MKNKKLVIMLIIIIGVVSLAGCILVQSLVFRAISGYSAKLQKQEDMQFDSSSVQVDIGQYNITSEPIGIGEYTLEQSQVYRNSLYTPVTLLALNVKKNTNAPWCGAITVEWELFDTDGISIGKAIGKSNSLQMGKSDLVQVDFKINDNGKAIYNQKEIAKIVLTSLTEENDLHRFLESNFINKKKTLKKYLDEGNTTLFYSELEKVRQEYNAEEFPNQNRELDEMEEQAKTLDKNNEIASQQTTPKQTPVPSTSPTSGQQTPLSQKSTAKQPSTAQNSTNSASTDNKDSFLTQTKKALGVPKSLDVTYEMSQPYYWTAGQRTVFNISFYHNGVRVAGAAFDHTGNPVKDILMYNGQ